MGVEPAITICLVPQARSGPFVFHGELAPMLDKACAAGFGVVEVFPPDGPSVRQANLGALLKSRNLRLAALGTGAGWVVQKLCLVDPDRAARRRAIDFVRAIIDTAGELGAPAIIGSMQGRHGENEREEVLSRLAEALVELGAHAKQYNVPLLYEPLNRYETNLFNHQGEAADFIRQRRLANVKILCDLFHMNIEEADMGAALRQVGELLGHVHFVDSNRRAAGLGHMDYRPVVSALREIKYQGYLSAEAFPLPDPDTAARQTIQTVKTLFED